MRIKNDHWTKQQYIDFAATIKPGVTLRRLIVATKSSRDSVIYRLRGLHLIVACDDGAAIDGSTGWRWVRSAHRNRFYVIGADGEVLVDLVEHMQPNDFFVDSDQRLRGPLYNHIRSLNQLMEGIN